MRIIKYPEHFCDDSRPYWALLVCFLVANVLLIYTLYNRQPERYRRISRWLSIEAKALPSLPKAHAATAAAGQGGMMGTAREWLGSTHYAQEPRVDIWGMTLGNAASNLARRGDLGTGRNGIAVLAIARRSVPYLSGIRTGDVIVSLNRIPTYTLHNFEDAVRNVDTSQGILLDVYRHGRFSYMTLETQNARGW